MKIDISEVMRLKSSLSSTKEDMNSLFIKIMSELDNVCNNVKSGSLRYANNTLKDNMKHNFDRLNLQIDRIDEFMGVQIDSYRVTQEEATAALRSLIDSINGLYSGGAVTSGVAVTTSDTAVTNSNDSSKPNSISTTFTNYDLTDAQIRQIAALAIHEQGTAKGAAAEASLMANRFELYGSKFGDGAQGLLNYVRSSGWFANASSNMKDTGIVTEEAFNAVKSVLVDGKRTLPKYVDEHDCFSDLKGSHSRNSYVSSETVINNVYGSTYTFYSFPDSGSDPFGYTSEALRQKYGDECYSFEDL